MESSLYQGKTELSICAFSARPEGRVAAVGRGGGCVPIYHCLFVLCGPGKPLNANPCWLPQLGDLRASPSSGSHKRILYMWTSSFQKEAGDLALLLEMPGGRLQRRDSTASSGF